MDLLNPEPQYAAPLWPGKDAATSKVSISQSISNSSKSIWMTLFSGACGIVIHVSNEYHVLT
jgi:hypothetical protein